jgi:hemolysin type calcium-binding protein/WD40 repeat protein
MRLGVVGLAAIVLVVPAPAGQSGHCTVPPGRHAAAYAPDGVTLAVVLPSGSDACPRWTAAISYRGDRVIRIATPSSEESAASLSWAPDSRRFVAGLVSTRGAVVVYDTQRVLEEAASRIAQGVEPVWSPDGRTIAYTDPRDGLHLVAPDGSNDRRIAAGDRPAWAPDASRLAYHRQGAIFVANHDGSGERRLTAGERASWSPDGSWLAVLQEGSTDLVRAHGSVEQRVGAGGPVQWSPRGDELVLRDTAGVVRVVDLDTRAMRLIAEDVAAVSVIPTSWDRIATVLAVGRRSEVYVARITGAYPVRRTASQCSLYRANCVDGTDRADRIVGTVRRDAIFPGAGDDRVRSGAGDDRVDTAHGRDEVLAGPGNDVVVTHGNDDRVRGGPGIDMIVLGNGEDLAEGGRGSDSIIAAGDGRIDRVRCGQGRDYVFADPVDRVAANCETVRRAT